jgi:hypothetical protein
MVVSRRVSPPKKILRPQRSQAAAKKRVARILDTLQKSIPNAIISGDHSVGAMYG